MASSFVLSTLIDAVQGLLMDAGAAVFGDTSVTESIRLALGEYSHALPRVLADALAPTAKREIDLSSATGLLTVTDVLFPYTAATPEYPPNHCLYRLYIDTDDSSKLKLYLDTADEPNGTDTARVFYQVGHTLKDLDSATATTWETPDDGLIILGSAGHALMARATDVAETDSLMAVSTPNYAALASRFLKQFRQQLTRRSRI
jgi:hypothetical protein